MCGAVRGWLHYYCRYGSNIKGKKKESVIKLVAVIAVDIGFETRFDCETSDIGTDIRDKNRSVIAVNCRYLGSGDIYKR